MNKKITVLFCLILAFVLLPFALRTASAEGETSGQCGDNLDWSFDEESGTLTITGSGEMYDYSFYDAVPWAAYQEEIKYIELPDGLLQKILDAAMAASQWDVISAVTEALDL